MEDILIISLAIIAGAISGLLPGLPAWLMPFLTIPFLQFLNLEQLLLFWMISVIGSQYFGSIAGIMFGVPGEGSTLVYIEKINELPIKVREQLVKLTAAASAIASTVALSLMYVLHSSIVAILPFVGTTEAKFAILWMVSVLVCLLNWRHIMVSLILFSAGVILSAKSAVALPEWMIHLNRYTYDLTIVAMIVSLLVIPGIIKDRLLNKNTSDTISFNNFWKPTITGTGIGIVSGFLPGPTATISSITAFKYTKGTLLEKVVSVEAANNSVVIIGGFLLLYLQIPMSLDAVAVHTVLIGNGWNVFHDFMQKDNTYFFLMLLVSIFLLWVLASRSNRVYGYICTHMNNNSIFAIGLACVLSTFDIFISQGSIMIEYYLLWVISLVFVGITLKKHKITPLPIIFGFIFGDPLVWSTYQVINFYF